jgi:choline dehydrogenase-like flavoprotein
LRDSKDAHSGALLGEDLAELGQVLNATPKMKIPQFRYVQRDFARTYGLTTSGVRATGAMATGGLSTMWGAGTFAYDDGDLIGFPIDAAAMEPSYAAVAARIGISGVRDDDLGDFLGRHELLEPLPLHPAARSVLEHMDRNRSRLAKHGFRLGRTRNAVITQPRDGREACRLDKACLWGCPHGSIYSAIQDLQKLKNSANFSYRSKCFVRAIRSLPGGAYRLEVGPAGSHEPHEAIDARRIVLAAGAIGTGVLVADALGLYGQPQPILSHPAMAFAFVVPGRIGHPEEERGFALGQLAYALEGETPRERAFGVVFSAEGLLAADLALQIPYFTATARAAIIRTIQPAMLVANCYLPSDLAQCSLTVSRNGSDRAVHLEGGYAAAFEERFADTRHRVVKAMRHLGAWALPGGVKRAELGSDGHFAGSVPMTASPDRPVSCDPSGEIRGLPGIFVADGAALPRLSGKHPTFTIMANADRIGRRLANALII